MPAVDRDAHNHRNRFSDSNGAVEPRDTLLMGVEGEDAEPVIVHVEGETATLELVDGQRLALDLSELRNALRDAA